MLHCTLGLIYQKKGRISRCFYNRIAPSSLNLSYTYQWLKNWFPYYIRPNLYTHEWNISFPLMRTWACGRGCRYPPAVSSSVKHQQLIYVDRVHVRGTSFVRLCTELVSCIWLCTLPQWNVPVISADIMTNAPTNSIRVWPSGNVLLWHFWSDHFYGQLSLGGPIMMAS